MSGATHFVAVQIGLCIVFDLGVLYKALKQATLAVQQTIEAVHQRKVLETHGIAMPLRQLTTYLERVYGSDQLCAFVHTHTGRSRLAVHLTLSQREVAASARGTYVDIARRPPHYRLSVPTSHGTSCAPYASTGRR